MYCLQLCVKLRAWTGASISQPARRGRPRAGGVAGGAQAGGEADAAGGGAGGPGGGGQAHPIQGPSLGAAHAGGVPFAHFHAARAPHHISGPCQQTMYGGKRARSAAQGLSCGRSLMANVGIRVPSAICGKGPFEGSRPAAEWRQVHEPCCLGLRGLALQQNIAMQFLVCLSWEISLHGRNMSRSCQVAQVSGGGGGGGDGCSGGSFGGGRKGWGTSRVPGRSESACDAMQMSARACLTWLACRPRCSWVEQWAIGRRATGKRQSGSRGSARVHISANPCSTVLHS